jgi:hypothetical protein
MITDLIKAADGMTELSSRLRLVTKTSAELNYVQQELYKNSQLAGTKIKDNTDVYFGLARATRTLGISQKELISLTDGRNQHQYHVDISQSPDQQTRYQYSDNNDNTSHRWRSLLAHLALQPKISHRLADLQHLQLVDDTASDSRRDEQGQDQCQSRTE